MAKKGRRNQKKKNTQKIMLNSKEELYEAIVDSYIRHKNTNTNLVEFIPKLTTEDVLKVSLKEREAFIEKSYDDEKGVREVVEIVMNADKKLCNMMNKEVSNDLMKVMNLNKKIDFNKKQERKLVINHGLKQIDVCRKLRALFEVTHNIVSDYLKIQDHGWTEFKIIEGAKMMMENKGFRLKWEGVLYIRVKLYDVEYLYDDEDNCVGIFEEGKREPFGSGRSRTKLIVKWIDKVWYEIHCDYDEYEGEDSDGMLEGLYSTCVLMTEEEIKKTPKFKPSSAYDMDTICGAVKFGVEVFGEDMNELFMSEGVDISFLDNLKSFKMTGMYEGRNEDIDKTAVNIGDNMRKLKLCVYDLDEILSEYSKEGFIDEDFYVSNINSSMNTLKSLEKLIIRDSEKIQFKILNPGAPFHVNADCLNGLCVINIKHKRDASVSDETIAEAEINEDGSVSLL